MHHARQCLNWEGRPGARVDLPDREQSVRVSQPAGEPASELVSASVTDLHCTLDREERALCTLCRPLGVHQLELW